MRAAELLLQVEHLLSRLSFQIWKIVVVGLEFVAEAKDGGALLAHAAFQIDAQVG